MRELDQTLWMLGAMGLGAGLMYAFDPRQGARRRALLRDKARHALHEERDMMSKGMRDLGHRVGGKLRHLRSPTPRDVSDHVLVERVRSAMGHHVSHPSAIDVAATDGHIVLRGLLLEDELDGLLEAVNRVPGVDAVDTELELHATGDHVPGLQGHGRLPARNVFRRELWPPSVRLLATGTGAALAGYGLRSHGLPGTAMTVAGGYLLLRATTNMPPGRLFGIGARRRAVDLQKTITVHAPIDRVYRFLTDIENFPRFMRHVHVVRRSEHEPGVSHWKVQGIGGITMSWDAVETRRDPNRAFAWKTKRGQSVEHAGIIQLEEAGPGATRLNIRMSYNPPAGAVGHAVLRLFGSDAKSLLDEDLVRLKSLLEEGKTRIPHQPIQLQELH